MRALVISLCFAALVAAVASTPGAATDKGRAEALLQELDELVDEGERTRAADPWLIEELRSLIDRYRRPWHAELLVDTFDDGDYTRAPAWTVAEGRFTVDAKTGLHTKVSPRPSDAEEGKGSAKLEDEVARKLLGELLGSEGEGSEGEQAPPGRSEIYIERSITNAFSIEVELSSSLKAGRLAFGPYQGGDRQLGYRLVYRPEAQPAIEIARASPRGSSVVQASGKKIELEDGSVHTLRWNRHGDGTMTVAIDGKEVLAAPDRRYADPFDGFVLINEGGEYRLRRVVVYGTDAQPG